MMLRTAFFAALVAAPDSVHQNLPAVFYVGRDRPGWFICDAVAGPVAAFVGSPDTKGTAAIALLDRRTGQIVKQDYQVGDPDHGAGQIYWPLSQGGRSVGSIHGNNPGMVDAGDGNALPPMKNVTIGKLSLDCRWLPHLRLIGVGLKRSVAMTRENGRLVYRSFDRASLGPPIDASGGARTNRASSTIVGGRDVAGSYSFRKDGYTIRLGPFGASGKSVGTVTVMSHGKADGYTALLGLATMPDP